MDIQTKSRIIEQAFISYHLKGIKAMQTYLNAQAKKHGLTYSDILDLEEKINILIEAEENAEEKTQKLDFTCNIF